ncbi:MAG: hypothetical protein ACLFP8_06970 [Alphaproteobacteria bacterium]
MTKAAGLTLFFNAGSCGGNSVETSPSERARAFVESLGLDPDCDPRLVRGAQELLGRIVDGEQAPDSMAAFGDLIQLAGIGRTAESMQGADHVLREILHRYADMTEQPAPEPLRPAAFPSLSLRY